MEKKFFFGLVVFLVFLGGYAIFNGLNNKEAVKSVEEQPKVEENKTMIEEKPAMQIGANKKYTAVLKTIEGDIVIELNSEQTPITVNNFVALARKSFYNNTIFHRVINGFMIQGGDPKGD